MIGLAEILRDYGDAVEADLVRHANGTDLRDLYRRDSGLTPRRLLVLIKALPPDALLWAEARAALEKSLKPTPDQIRAAAARYQR